MPFLYDERTGKLKWFEMCGQKAYTSPPYPIKNIDNINVAPVVGGVSLQRMFGLRDYSTPPEKINVAPEVDRVQLRILEKYWLELHEIDVVPAVDSVELKTKNHIYDEVHEIDVNPEVEAVDIVTNNIIYNNVEELDVAPIVDGVTLTVV